MAGARKLLGDVAFLTDRLGDAAREYDAALAILKQFPLSAPGMEGARRTRSGGTLLERCAQG